MGPLSLVRLKIPFLGICQRSKGVVAAVRRKGHLHCAPFDSGAGNSSRQQEHQKRPHYHGASEPKCSGDADQVQRTDGGDGDLSPGLPKLLSASASLRWCCEAESPASS